jgi:hypothetical protein
VLRLKYKRRVSNPEVDELKSWRLRRLPFNG